MRQMFDSVDASRLPADAQLVACYIDGAYANEAAVRARCPHATVVRITVTGLDDGDCCDVEPGDLGPVSGAAWAKRRIAAGHQPTIYCNVSTWPQVQAEVANAGIAGKVSYFIAHYDGKAELIPGAVAKQYQERTDQNLDYSVAADYWPGVDPVVKPQDYTPPTPLPTIEEQDMVVVYADGRALCLLTGGRLEPLKSNAEKDAYVSVGVPIHKTTVAFFDLLDGVSKRLA